MNNNCINCKYFGTGGCVHPHKVNCVNSSLWAPKWYRGKRSDVSVLNDYCGVSQEIIDKVCEVAEVWNKEK